MLKKILILISLVTPFYLLIVCNFTYAADFDVYVTDTGNVSTNYNPLGGNGLISAMSAFSDYDDFRRWTCGYYYDQVCSERGWAGASAAA